MKQAILVISTLFTLLLIIVSPAHAEEPIDYAALLKQKNAAIQDLQQQLTALQYASPLGREELGRKSLVRLQAIAAEVRQQRQAMADFQGFVGWMNQNLAGYNKYLEAGSVAAGFARVLPIPYAGQAGMLAKFVSQATVSLNTASTAINKYLATSQQFVSRVDALGSTPEGKLKEIEELSRLAETDLRRDMEDVGRKLSTTADLSASALSFLESLNHYVGNADEYMNKTKALFKRGDGDKQEKGFLSASIEALKNRAGKFNERLRRFEETSRRAAPQIASLEAYRELLAEIDGQQGISSKN